MLRTAAWPVNEYNARGLEGIPQGLKRFTLRRRLVIISEV